MILVTVGNHIQPFDRLIRAADGLAELIEEKVVIQAGHSKYVPTWANYFDFTSGNHILELTEQARVQISHAGSGSIITALRLKKPLIVTPRLKRFEEHIDDHQLELANALHKQGKLIAVYDIKPHTLMEAVEEVVSLKMTPKTGIAENHALVNYLKAYLAGFSRELQRNNHPVGD
jgi:beta-1,4-N-acetylglucosaminyltransferase